jgi:catechol 2,3-dioxygenase-like lactoylglutathione lyase family enzyme
MAPIKRSTLNRLSFSFVFEQVTGFLSLPFFLCALLFLCTSANVKAQQPEFRFDHFALEVRDLTATGDFYKKALGLQEIPHPSEPEGFRWFVIHGTTQLHLIRKEQVPAEDRKSEHLCLSTSDLPGFIRHLEENQIPYWDWPGTRNAVTLRADGVRQIYLKDPENNWVEINDAPSRAPNTRSE